MSIIRPSYGQLLGSADSLPLSKLCPRCGESKPREQFGIRADRGTLQSWCKTCNLARVKAKYQPHPRIVPTEKPCTDCGVVLPVDAFPIKSKRASTRRSVCRACKNRTNAEYKTANRERVLTSAAAYRARVGRKELTERQRTWREAHPEQYFAIHSGWKKRNPDAVRAMGNKRRVAEQNGGPHYTAAEWKALKVRYDHRCLMCKQQEPTIRLTVDHIMPVSIGGSNAIDNLQPLCKSCNSKKHRGIIDLRPLVQAILNLE